MHSDSHAHLHRRAPEPAPAPKPEAQPDPGFFHNIGDFVNSRLGLTPPSTTEVPIPDQGGDRVPMEHGNTHNIPSNGQQTLAQVTHFSAPESRASVPAPAFLSVPFPTTAMDQVANPLPQGASTLVMTVFETMPPTFSGSIVGYTTLTNNLPVHTEVISKASALAVSPQRSTPTLIIPSTLEVPKKTLSPLLLSPTPPPILSQTPSPLLSPTPSPLLSPKPSLVPEPSPSLSPTPSTTPTALSQLRTPITPPPSIRSIPSATTSTSPNLTSSSSSTDQLTGGGASLINASSATPTVTGLSTTSASPSSVGDSSNGAATASVAIGVVSAVVLVALVLCLLFYRRRKRMALQRLDDDEKLNGPFAARSASPHNTFDTSNANVNVYANAHATTTARDTVTTAAATTTTAATPAAADTSSSRFSSAPRLSIRPVTQLFSGGWLDRRPSRGPAYNPASSAPIALSPSHSGPQDTRANVGSAWERPNISQNSKFANSSIPEEAYQTSIKSLNESRPVSSVSSLSTDINNFPQPSTIKPNVAASVVSINNSATAATTFAPITVMNPPVRDDPLTASGPTLNTSASPMATATAHGTLIARKASLNNKLALSHTYFSEPFDPTAGYPTPQQSLVPTSPAGSDFSVASLSPNSSPALSNSAADLAEGGGPAELNVYRVQLEFQPTLPDEMELQVGHLVRLLHEYDDGWALCISLDRSHQGVVPRTCLSTRPVKPRRAKPGVRGPPINPSIARGPSPGLGFHQQPLRPISPRHDGRLPARLDGRLSPRHDGRLSPRHDGRLPPRLEGRHSPRLEGRSSPRPNSPSTHMPSAMQQFQYPPTVSASGPRPQSPNATYRQLPSMGADPRNPLHGNRGPPTPYQRSQQLQAPNGAEGLGADQVTGSAF